MANDDNIPKIEEPSAEDNDQKSEGAEETVASGEKPAKGKFSLKLPLGLTPILLFLAVVALVSAYLSISSLMKMAAYRQRLDTALMAASDPANLAHFKHSNQTVLNSPIYEPGSLFVVFGSDFGADWEMLRALDEDGVINRSIANQNMDQMMLRFEQDVINLKPRAFMLLPPVNRIDEVKKTLTKSRIIYDLAAEMGVEPILVKLPPIPADQEITEGGYRGKVIAYNRALSQIAAQTGWTILDLFSPLANGEYYLSDDHCGDHLWPNLAAYRLITDQVRAMVDSISTSGSFRPPDGPANANHSQGLERLANR